MPEPDLLHDEIRTLAEQVAAGPAAVADLAPRYRRVRQQALDRAGLAVFLAGAEVIDENHPLPPRAKATSP